MDCPFKILVVDDAEQSRELIAAFVTQLGHTAIQAKDGAEAINLFHATSPDMILMDVMMPVMDGHQATREIRKLAGDAWLPIIFLSANDQVKDLINGLQSGGDDYLAKPVNLQILQAKIKAMKRIAGMQRDIADKAAQLALYHAENEQEQDLAKHLLERIIQADKPNDPLIEHLILPTAARFSGDIIATGFTPSNILHVILADSAGHGLSAALNALPVVEVFYGMTRKGYGLSNIARELNNKIKQLMPTERFVAAILAAINFADRTIEIWNGGIPTAYFVDENGTILREFHATHPPMGILNKTDFHAKTETFHWNKPGRLFLYSDGLIEAENIEGEQFGTGRLLQALNEKSDEGQFWYLYAAANKFVDLDNAADDISIAAIHCPMNYINELVVEQDIEPLPPSDEKSGESRLTLKLGPTELKSFDVLPWLITWLTQLHLSQKQRQNLFLMLSEIYNNALDHGVLGLDSSLKHQPEGFGLYLDLRAERLAALQQGSIEIELERVFNRQPPHLKIRVRDSGQGFAAHAILNADISNSHKPAGRGIVLIKNLCAELKYPGNGNEVVATYTLEDVKHLVK